MNEHLYIQHFGPVETADIEIRPLTLFIGNQGTGKSTIAKLYSMFKWLEKALQQGAKSVADIERYNRFKKIYCKYHRLHNFFSPSTIIRFTSERYLFDYSHEKLKITARAKALAYDIPKIMYIPAERTILSLMKASPRDLRSMPESLATFSDAFEEGKQSLASGYDLPYDQFRFSYDQLNNISWISDDNHKTRLTEAASGIQSSVPICVVSEYLTRLVVEGNERGMSRAEIKLLKEEVVKIMNADYSESVKVMMLKNLSGFSHYSHFINVVEELEISLFPKTQVGVFRLLVELLNRKKGNKLILTTHSPYLLAALNISIMSALLADKAQGEACDILPAKWHLQPDDVAAYVLSHDEEDAYCRRITSETTGLVSVNDLDTASIALSDEFRKIYALYLQHIKK